MAFIKHHLFEIEIRDGQIIGEMPDFIRRFLEEHNMPESVYIHDSTENPDNYLAEFLVRRLGGEAIPGTSSQREIDPSIFFDAFV